MSGVSNPADQNKGASNVSNQLSRPSKCRGVFQGSPAFSPRHLVSKARRGRGEQRGQNPPAFRHHRAERSDQRSGRDGQDRDGLQGKGRLRSVRLGGAVGECLLPHPRGRGTHNLARRTRPALTLSPASAKEPTRKGGLFCVPENPGSAEAWVGVYINKRSPPFA